MPTGPDSSSIFCASYHTNMNSSTNWQKVIKLVQPGGLPRDGHTNAPVSNPQKDKWN